MPPGICTVESSESKPSRTLGIGTPNTGSTVCAARSLTGAFGGIAREFEAANPGIEVKLNFAGSQRLRSQL